MSLLMFYLPPESGEKVSLGITCLLSFSVFQFIIADKIPETSDYIPVLSKPCNLPFIDVYLNLFIQLPLDYKAILE